MGLQFLLSRPLSITLLCPHPAALPSSQVQHIKDIIRWLINITNHHSSYEKAPMVEFYFCLTGWQVIVFDEEIYMFLSEN